MTLKWVGHPLHLTWPVLHCPHMSGLGDGGGLRKSWLILITCSKARLGALGGSLEVTVSRGTFLPGPLTPLWQQWRRENGQTTLGKEELLGIVTTRTGKGMARQQDAKEAHLKASKTVSLVIIRGGSPEKPQQHPATPCITAAMGHAWPCLTLTAVQHSRWACSFGQSCLFSAAACKFFSYFQQSVDFLQSVQI